MILAFVSANGVSVQRFLDMLMHYSGGCTKISHMWVQISLLLL